MYAVVSAEPGLKNPITGRSALLPPLLPLARARGGFRFSELRIGSCGWRWRRRRCGSSEQRHTLCARSLCWATSAIVVVAGGASDGARAFGAVGDAAAARCELRRRVGQRPFRQSTETVSSTTFVHLTRARGASSLLRIALGLELEPPADRLRRASSHAGAALWLVGAVDAEVADSWSSRVRGSRA
jgi:hypothetical protein